MNQTRICVLGGGTGTYTVLSGLKQHKNLDLSAVVTMSDDGGSTGILRDELGVLPPGDVRQGLVALSEADKILRDLFNYRFISEGGLHGHNMGNILLGALEKITGDPLEGIRQAHHILKVRGQVIPVSAIASRLHAELEDGSVLKGEHFIDEADVHRSPIKKCFIVPEVQANPEAIEAILQAKIIVMGPGDLYTSLAPVLLVEGIKDALIKTNAKIVFVINLMTKRGQTDAYTAQTFVKKVEELIAPRRIDFMISNAPAIDDAELLARYAAGGELPVIDDLGDDVRVVRVSLISDAVVSTVAGDKLRRSFIRHDTKKLAEAIVATHLKP